MKLSSSGDVLRTSTWGGPWYFQLSAALLGLIVLLGLQVPDQGSVRADARVDGGSDVAATHVALPDGEQIYNTRCMSCHQMKGQGVPGTFPPISETDWVNGDKGRLVRLLLHGLSGKIKVNGETYSGVMPPWGGALDDEGIAAVATYVRSNFGNDASEITAEEVAKVRAATKGRSKPWTGKELKKPVNQGIPGDSSATAD